MKKALLAAALFTIATYGAKAQRVVAENVDGFTYAVVDCSGLPAGSVKTPEEIAASKTATGRVVRHIHTGGNGSNPDVNAKVSPRFALSPVFISGTGVPASSPVAMSWWEASGYTEASVNNSINETGVDADTGCPMYRGLSGTDPIGTWRLPTQRESLLIACLRTDFSTVVPSYAQINNISLACSTEYSTIRRWRMLVNSGGLYTLYIVEKSLGIAVRCVRDLP